MNKREHAKELRLKCLDMIAVCKKECREFTDEEQSQFDETKNELIALSEEIKAVDDKVDEVAQSVPDVPAESAPAENPGDSEAPVDEEQKSEEEQPADAPVDGENPDENAPAEEEKKSSEEEEINNNEEEKPADAEQPSEPSSDAPQDAPQDEEPKKDIKRSIDNMKDFSLLRAIRSVANNTKMEDIDKAILAAGAEEFRSNGLQATGQIQIPGEKRAVTMTVGAEHDDIIETEFDSILTPLYAKTALVESGAQMMTGLVGDIQIPVMDSKNNVGWETEIDDAMQTSNTFTNKKMSPHRISAFIDISKQLLAQDSIGVENAIRQDLLNALTNKLEATFLGNGDGSVTKGEGDDAVTTAGVAPKGILNGKTATSVSNYAALCDFEAGLELQDIYNPARYILSPKAKAALRAMNYGGKTTGMVMDTPNSVDGTPAVSTTLAGTTEKTFIYGDFSQVVIGQWAGLDLVVDNLTQATKGCVRVVINAYYDCIVKRPEAILYGKIALI